MSDLRTPQTDKRKPGELIPNNHYYGDMFYKHLKIIGAFLLLILLILLIAFKELEESVFECFKILACLCAGFLFGSIDKK